jgi:hypothetical protein
VLQFIEHYGLKMLGAVAALCVVGLVTYLIIKNVRAGIVLRPDARTVGGSIMGLAAGGVIGFLLRPTIPLLGGQLPFTTIIRRGANLEGEAQTLIPFAQTSFNYLLAGALAGALLGLAVAYLSAKTELGSKTEAVEKQTDAG